MAGSQSVINALSLTLLFAIEPRFLSGTQFAGSSGLSDSAAGTSAFGGSPGGAPIAGAYGLE